MPSIEQLVSMNCTALVYLDPGRICLTSSELTGHFSHLAILYIMKYTVVFIL